MKFKLILFIGFVFLANSCNSNNSFDFNIISPKESQIYSVNQKILFAVDSVTDEVTWYMDGIYFENGNNFFKSLSCGSHTVTVIVNGIEKEIQVSVHDKIIQNNFELLRTNNLEKYLNDDIKSFGLCALDSKNVNLKIEFSNSKELKVMKIPVDYNFAGKQIYNGILNINPRTSLDENFQKEFFVLNTNIQNDCHRICCKIYYHNCDLIFWIPQDCDEQTEKLIDKCISKITSLILPRLKKIWGYCQDVDGNGKLNVVFSSSINEEERAIGFFNPNDFFSRNLDVNSDSYNPFSNESDVIYLAFPSDQKKTYGVESICATFAHECAHALNFSNKSYKEYKLTGNEQQMELFLDEGLSHLTESLCGLGTSGGNVDFVNHFLANSNLYSLCKNNYLGQSDSAGQRGGICLFLYWLFEKSGGMEIDSAGELKDCGGISLLKKIISSRFYGWDSIGDAYGKVTDLLFMDFCNELLSGWVPAKIDAVTKEPILGCEKILPYSCSEVRFILPYSVIKIEDLKFIPDSFKMNSADQISNVYLWCGYN